MGHNKKNSGPSRPKPSSSTPPSSSVPPMTDYMVSADRAGIAIMKRSYGKAQKIAKEALAKHKNSPILHRVNASLHFKLATLLKESAAKLKPLKELANSTHKATILSPNSLSFSRLHVSILVELSKLTKEYDKVIQECDRGLAIQNPIDSLNNLIIDDVDFQGVELSLEARIKNARNDIAKYKNSMNIIKILDVDGEERIIYRSIDERNIKKDRELKEIIKKKKELENKIEEIVNLQKKLSNVSEKRSLTLEKIIGKAKKTARVRKYLSEMSYENKKRFLEVRIDELEQYFEKDDVAREALMEAIGYAKEKGKWKFWECCFCGEKFVDCEMGVNHYEEVHVGALSEELESVVPGQVPEYWVNAIKYGDWRPVNIPVALEIILNKSNSDEGWPLSDDTERANILQTMQCLLKLFVGNKCLVESLPIRLVEYARGQLLHVIPALLIKHYGLDRSLHCLCFLTVPELNGALIFIQEMYALCDLDGLMKDGDIANQLVFDTKEMIAFSSDFKGLLLDERLLQQNITAVEDGSAATSAVDDSKDDEIITVGEDGSGATFATSDDIIDWLFCFSIEEQVASWTQLRGGTKVFEVPDSDFSKLKSLCERKCDHNDYRTAASAIKRLILEEDAKRKQFPESEMQTDMSLLREQRKELIERDGDAVFRSCQLQLDVIRDILEDALSISFDQIRSEEDGQMMQDCVFQANRYTRAAFQRFYMGLMDEAVKIEVMIVRHIAAMEKFKLKLRRVCAYDYRSIMLPFLKLFIKAQLEGLVDKDASEKSAAAPEALLAELALVGDSKDFSMVETCSENDSLFGKQLLSDTPHTHGIQWPYAIICPPEHPCYELCFLHSFRILNVNFNISNSMFLSFEPNTGWLLLATKLTESNKTKVCYYNVKNQRMIPLPDIKFAMSTAHGCFSLIPTDDKNVTMVVFPWTSRRKLLVIKYFSPMESWAYYSFEMDIDKFLVGHVSTKAGFIWIRLTDGLLHVLYDWQNLDFDVNWAAKQFDELANCDLVSTALDRGKIFVLTHRNGHASVYELVYEGMLGLENSQLRRLDSLAGRNIFTVANGTGFVLPPLPLEGRLNEQSSLPLREGNGIYFSGFGSRDIVKIQYEPGASLEGRGLKSCRAPTNDLCRCSTAWGLTDRF